VDSFLLHHLDVTLVDSVVRALITIQPYQNDTTLLPVWMELVELGLARLGALVALAIQDEEAITSPTRQYGVQVLPKLLAAIFAEQFTALFGQEAPKPQVLGAAVTLFSGIFRSATTSDMIAECAGSVAEAGDATAPIPTTTALGGLIAAVNAALAQIRYKDSWGSILQLAGAVLEVGALSLFFV
jgi:hypothetical protein